MSEADDPSSRVIALELSELLDVHLAELRARGADETVLAPLEYELRRCRQERLAG